MKEYEDIKSIFKNRKNNQIKEKFNIFRKNIKFPIFIKAGQSKKIVFFFPGAFDITQEKPKFQRSSHFNDLDINAVSFFDPTLFLSDNLSLGWFQGNDDSIDYFYELKKIIKEIVAQLEISNENILFFGSSAGGISALKVAQHFPKSNVYLSNIQTDVLKYYKPAVQSMLDVCYKNRPINIRNLNVYDIDENINVYYAQNKADKFHYINHFQPFVFESKNKRMNCQFIEYFDAKSGHNPISKEVELSVINAILGGKNVDDIFIRFKKENVNEDLLYKDGYLLTELEMPNIPNRYSLLHIGKRYFYYDPTRPVYYLTEGDISILIYGYALDIKIKSSSLEKIGNNLLEELKIKEDHFLDQLDYLNGRFVVVTTNNDKTHIYHDACGTKQVYYANKEGKILCSSHAHLIKDNYDEGMSDEWQVSKDLKEYFAYGYPGNTTPYKGIYVLTPNMRLELNHGVVERYFPRENLTLLRTEEEFVTAADKICSLFREQLQVISEEYTPLISLTAGKDSRFTLAAMDKTLLELSEFFTYRAKDAHEVDYKVSIDIADILELKHYRLDLIDYDFSNYGNLERILNKNTYLSHGYKISYMYKDQFQNSNYLHIRSNISEIGRCFYGINNESNFNELSMLHLFTNRPNLLASKKIRNTFITYYKITEFDKLYNYDPYDLFYWEHRMGVWLPLVLIESDIAFDTYNPFNNRHILKLLLSLPEEYRKNDYIYNYILNAMDNKVKAIPINPPTY